MVIAAPVITILILLITLGTGAFAASRRIRHKGYLDGLQNADRLAAQQADQAAVIKASVKIPDKVFQPPVSASLAGAIYGLNFHDDDALQDEEVEWIHPGGQPPKSGSGVWPPAGSYVQESVAAATRPAHAPVPKARRDFVQGAAETNTVLQAALQHVATKHGIPPNELVVQFDEWPFQDNVPIQHSRYDETGLPCHTFYSIAVQELFRPEPTRVAPEPAPDGPPTPWEPTLYHLRSEHSKPHGWRELHRILATSDADLKLPVAAAQQATQDFLDNTTIKRTQDKSPPVAVAGGILVRFEPDDLALSHYFTTRDWDKGAQRQVESLVKAGALVMTPNYYDFVDDPEFDQ